MSENGHVTGVRINGVLYGQEVADQTILDMHVTLDLTPSTIIYMAEQICSSDSMTATERGRALGHLIRESNRQGILPL